ncbi:MAG: amidohydrolase family protein [Bacteroidales bacterium]|nr:amidohydrolase family protein [Bacteroidales bacterium]
MKRILDCLAVLLCVAGCQKYESTLPESSPIYFKTYDKQMVEVGDEIEVMLSSRVTKDNYAAIKAEISSSLGDVTAVTTKGGNASSWEIEVKNPEFGDEGKVSKNPVVIIRKAVPGYSNDAVLTVTLIDNAGKSFSVSKTLSPEKISADLVVYGKIFTSDNYELAEAFAVKDGKYIYVGDSASAAVFVEEGRTQVIDHSRKGLVMPSCGDGHAHYMTGYGFKSVGTMISNKATVDDFLNKIVPEAAEKARQKGSSAIFGFGWNYFAFKDNIPTRQQLDSICSDIPMYFADEEGHKGLANTICLVKAGILSADGKAIKKGTDIRGGEIMVDANGIPNGFVKEQAGTYVRSALDNDKLYTVEVASNDIRQIQDRLLSNGYTMYMDGWSNYFFNDNFYKAAKNLDEAGDLNIITGLSHEIESWAADTLSTAIAKAIAVRNAYASDHILPRWIKLFIDGTVEGGTGYVEPLYPATEDQPEHQGLVNWTEEEVKGITSEANNAGITLHIHTMGNKAVNLCVNAFIAGGKDEMRNTVVHVRNVMPADWQRMAAHNIYAVSGMLWHHFHYMAPYYLWWEGMVPEGMEFESYPMLSFFNFGINMSSHTDYPALSGSPEDPFGIMEIAVTGMLDHTQEYYWWPEELITREQALTALTINVAKQMFIDEERGSITTGKYADFILVDKDVLSCPVMQIHTAKTAATYFEGEKVFPRLR